VENYRTYVQVSRDEASDLLRSVGGMLLAAGAIVLLIRKSGHGQWSDLARLLVVLAPATLLYLLALRPPRDERAAPWQSVLLVTSVVLIPVALYLFLHWVGANTRHLLYDAVVFAVTGCLAAFAARRARVASAGLLAALSLLAAWLFVWTKILNHPSANTFRWLLVASAALLLLLAARVRRAGIFAAGEIATAGGIAAVAAGVLGVIVGAFVGLLHTFTSGSMSASSGASSAPLFRHGHVLRQRHVVPEVVPPSVESSPAPSFVHAHTNGLQHLGWDVYLLIASLVLIWIGSRIHTRGLGYVGGIGLLAFVASAGTQITRLESGHAPTHALAVWPLVLVIVGLAALAASFVRSREA
jgi:hypothetical protein